MTNGLFLEQAVLRSPQISAVYLISVAQEVALLKRCPGAGNCALFRVLQLAFEMSILCPKMEKSTEFTRRWHRSPVTPPLLETEIFRLETRPTSCICTCHLPTLDQPQPPNKTHITSCSTYDSQLDTLDTPKTPRKRSSACCMSHLSSECICRTIMRDSICNCKDQHVAAGFGL
jgi:hypothetical protein